MQAVERTFSILRSLAVSGGIGVSDLARATQLPKSTVHRILTSLETQGIVENGGDGTYSIGPGLSDLIGAVPASTSVRHVSRPYLRRLSAEFGEAAGITVIDGRFAHYVEQFSSDSAVQTRDWSGMRLPLHTVAGGLALMMPWASSRVVAYAAAGLVVNTPATAATTEELATKLEVGRSNGHVWTYGDFDREVNGVAAPVMAPDGTAPASISVYGPAYRFPGEANAVEIGRRVGAAAAAISGRLH